MLPALKRDGSVTKATRQACSPWLFTLVEKTLHCLAILLVFVL